MDPAWRDDPWADESGPGLDSERGSIPERLRLDANGHSQRPFWWQFRKSFVSMVAALLFGLLGLYRGNALALAIGGVFFLIAAISAFHIFKLVRETIRERRQDSTPS